MSSTFWSNTIWFILLFVSSIIACVVILHKANNIKFAIAFLFSIIGFTFILEAILVIGFNAYTYHPKIVSDKYLDAVFGNYFSQISIASTALLIAVYNLPYIWYLIFSCIYFLIEELFVKLSIFEHFWYKSVYTLFGFIPFFWFINKWYAKAKNSTDRITNYISLFLSIFAINSLTIILSQRLLGIQIFKGKIFPEWSKDHTTTGLVYQFFQINLLIIIYKAKLPWVVKTLAFIGLFIGQYILYSTGFIYIPKGLFFPVTTLDLIGCYCWIAAFNCLLFKQTSMHHPD